jgi:hypothetical protein
MAIAARDRLARTLRGDAQTAFSVELTARPDDLIPPQGPSPLRLLAPKGAWAMADRLCG